MDALLEATSAGNVGKLQRIIRENPLILHYIPLESRENPLHLACLLGHLEFAREILTLKPEFARKLNPQGYSPLHMAAANGRVEIVKELVRFDQELCRVKGSDMMTPLHCATQVGEVGVINEILVMCPESIQDVTIKGETVLHLAVKNSQYQSLESLVDWIKQMGRQEIMKACDEENNTALGIAVQMKSRRALALLLASEDIESQGRLSEYIASSCDQPSCSTTEYADYFRFQKGRDSPGDARNALLVIAVLVTTATYQVGLSPPGGVWQDNSTMASLNSRSPIAGTSILAAYDSVGFIFMIGLNSIGFSLSLYMIEMMTSKFPLRAELHLCLLALYVTYGIAVSDITPHGLRPISTAFTSVLPTLVPAVMYLSRKYLRPMMGPLGRVLIKYKVFQIIADRYR